MSWDDIALACGTDKSSMGHGYMRVYETLLKHREVFALAEVGVWYGASLQMWARLFPNAYILGLDIEEREHLPWPGNVEVKIGDGPKMLEAVADAGEVYDVIIDDGSHRAADSLRTIRAATTALAPGGVLVIEDVAVSNIGIDLHNERDIRAGFARFGFREFASMRSCTGHRDKGDLSILFAERVPDRSVM